MTINISINDTEIGAAEGSSVLDVINASGT